MARTIIGGARYPGCAARWRKIGGFRGMPGKTMNKAFTNEDNAADAADDDEVDSAPPLPQGTRNYMTPGGHARLASELDRLTRTERPQLVATVAWAAGNGDRSENGDYIYGKKRLREIDRRIRFLVKRLDVAEVVDPAARRDDDNADQVFFGATVIVADAAGKSRQVSIVGIDEIDTARGYVSWISPIARALLKAREGDIVTLHTPGGVEELEVQSVRYESLATDA
jgi:transcription elongation factor GreB